MRRHYKVGKILYAAFLALINMLRALLNGFAIVAFICAANEDFTLATTGQFILLGVVMLLVANILSRLYVFLETRPERMEKQRNRASIQRRIKQELRDRQVVLDDSWIHMDDPMQATGLAR